MPSFDDAALDAEQRADVAAALEIDPWLADELALLLATFGPGARRRFWSAFATESRRHERPAAAVLAALEEAARDQLE